MGMILRGPGGTAQVQRTFGRGIVAMEAEMTRISTLALITLGAAALAACGTTIEQKAATGAVAGAVVAGPVGAAVGGAAGTAVGQAERPR